MGEIVQLAEGFWNIRGSFKIAGVVDIGTHASLARRSSGGFAMLDSYTLSGRALEEVLALTDDGRALEAVINLHPFHTVHCEAVARRFPNARHYGTARHLAKLPQIAWQAERTESDTFARLFADDFDFFVPRGVHFVPENPNLHFASVLAIHRASAALHVDDTLNWVPVPLLGGRLRFHPTLRWVLEDRPEAATEFRDWAEALAERCDSVHHLCTAHAARAPLTDQPPGAIGSKIREALEKVDSVLRRH